jgi:hypothetical protein
MGCESLEFATSVVQAWKQSERRPGVTTQETSWSTPSRDGLRVGLRRKAVAVAKEGIPSADCVRAWASGGQSTDNGHLDKQCVMSAAVCTLSRALSDASAVSSSAAGAGHVERVLCFGGNA